jgi:hypothetical protein
MSENENVAATEKAIEVTEPQNTEEVTEAVETQSPATEKGIEETSVEAEANTEEESNPDDDQEISYHAVEKEGVVTAIWEMQGRRHLRTLAPRSNEGKKILSLFETAG